NYAKHSLYELYRQREKINYLFLSFLKICSHFFYLYFDVTGKMPPAKGERISPAAKTDEQI
ncbi:hypothetical protein, partial [Paenibacillus phoenicis]|uniref:hypothetical protein n=1 Tax=Paenibacillus phoenicis TaxID=554117 RepID=UPI003D27293D